MFVCAERSLNTLSYSVQPSIYQNLSLYNACFWSPKYTTLAPCFSASKYQAILYLILSAFYISKILLRLRMFALVFARSKLESMEEFETSGRKSNLDGVSPLSAQKCRKVLPCLRFPGSAQTFEIVVQTSKGVFYLSAQKCKMPRHVCFFLALLKICEIALQTSDGFFLLSSQKSRRQWYVRCFLQLVLLK
jgi:hypothetical protein